MVQDDAAAPHDDERELTGPLRRCAVTRLELPVEDMLRFVTAPDASVVPDLARRLPGRGVWVDLHRARLEEAVKRNVFAKSMKRHVKPASDLVERIEVQLVKRLLDSLSLANKAGMVTPGFAQAESALDANTVEALFHGSDGAVGGREKLDRKLTAIKTAEAKPVIIVTELTIDQISLAIGRSNVVHAALTHGGATTRLLEEARRLQRFRASPEPP